MVLSFENQQVPIGTAINIQSIKNEIRITCDAEYAVEFNQTFENEQFTFVRNFTWEAQLDQYILKAEAKILGVQLNSNEDLHELAKHYFTPQPMVHLPFPQNSTFMLFQQIDYIMLLQELNSVGHGRGRN